MHRSGAFAITAALLGSVAPSLAEATVIDLTPGPGSSGSIGGVLFEYGKQRSSGSGNIQSFVRLQANGSEHGYNTSGRPVGFNETTTLAFTHDLQHGQIPVVTRGGSDYYEFILDANESQGGGNQFLSLDEVQIYTSPTGSQNTTNVAALGTLRFDLDALGESHVRIDTSFSSGSGSTDMTMLVPESFFLGVAGDHYIYLYTQFGLQPDEGSGANKKVWASGSTFEEWAIETFPDSRFNPEPASAALLAVSASALLARRGTGSRSRNAGR